MHFLLTNDDGIRAPGLAALEEAVGGLDDATLSVVAPLTEASMCGHRLTTHDPITVDEISENHFGISAMPADAVRVALFALGIKADCVISGVNLGANLGQDLPVSGTVAAAREAAYHGLPAIAVSHYLIRELEIDWARTVRWTRDILRELLAARLEAGEFWNVNLPHLPRGDAPLPERVRATPCREPLGVGFARAEDAAGRLLLQYNVPYKDRPAPEGSDVAVCFGGRVAVSRVKI